MKALILATSVSVGLALAASCGSSDSNGGDTAGQTTQSTTGASTGSASGGMGGAASDVCDPACAPPQFCSVGLTCIDEGTCAEDGDCGEGLVCDMDTNQCVPGGGCGSQEAKAEAVPPNMLIVLDRSCSMQDMVGASDKWTIAVGALVKMTTDFDAKIRFGMTLFPDIVDPSCEQDAIPIPVAQGNEAQIQALLNAALVPADPNYPDGPCVTNIDTAMQQAATEPALTDPDRKNYVLLLTDGKQANCSLAGGDPGTTQIITDLEAMNISTFVLGFGNGVDPAQMNAFADAGGVPYSDPNDPNTHYYKAEDQATLDAALAAIASQTLGCVFELDKEPPDASKIYVFFDNQPDGIQKDTTHKDGWDYDPATNQVTFYGAACDKLKGGTVKDVDIVFGCNNPTPS